MPSETEVLCSMCVLSPFLALGCFREEKWVARWIAHRWVSLLHLIKPKPNPMPISCPLSSHGSIHLFHLATVYESAHKFYTRQYFCFNWTQVGESPRFIKYRLIEAIMYLHYALCML